MKKFLKSPERRLPTLPAGRQAVGRLFWFFLVFFVLLVKIN
ncbi:MAG: hypothetical protein Q8N16_02670 [bacterium]|nr:hypothetical protein [bacterium]